MKSLVQLSPALNNNIKRYNIERLDRQKEEKNCTFGAYFGLPFPSSERVTIEIMAEWKLPSHFYNAIQHFASRGIQENDKGYYAWSRLYLSRILNYADRVKRLHQ